MVSWRWVMGGAWLALAGCNLVADIEPGRPQCQVDENINGLETGLDCGGPCPPCQVGQRCEEDRDCASRVCEEGICRAATCVDDRRNGDEGDVDCGGTQPGCPRCRAGRRCNLPSDCASFALYEQEQSSVSACFRESEEEDGLCLPACCSGDCAGCNQVFPPGPCQSPDCCEETCDAGPGAMIALLGQPCLISEDCVGSLQCLPEGEPDNLICK